MKLESIPVNNNIYYKKLKMNTVLNYVKNYAGHLLLFAYTCEVINGDHLIAQLCLLGWIAWREWKCGASCCKKNGTCCKK